MTDRTAVATGGGGVRPVPVLGVLVRLLPLWLAWLLVVVLGRLICRVAQRIPPVVRLTRRLRAGEGRWGEALSANPSHGDVAHRRTSE